MNNSPITRYLARHWRDALGVSLDGGAVAVQAPKPGEPWGSILAIGRLDDLPDGPTVDLDQQFGQNFDLNLGHAGGGVLVTPAHVNAHTHLELTSIGPVPYGGDFTQWIRGILDQRAVGGEAVHASAAEGVRLLRDGGVGYVGDIGATRHGEGAVWSALVQAGMPGVAFAEVLGYDGETANREKTGLQTLHLGEERSSVKASGENAVSLRRGLQPHAPYSTGRALYAACVEMATQHDLPLATHLAELVEEAEFIGQAKGLFRKFVENLGLWHDGLLETYGHGLSPVRWLEPYLPQRPWLLAHCNYVDDTDLDLLAKTGAAVAYCPIASEYFGHPSAGHAPHRYRDMIKLGIPVALGTDSILCQAPDETQPLAILPAIRRLHQRDRTDPVVLLAMATTMGHRALRQPEAWGRLAPGSPARFTAVPLPREWRGDDPLAAAWDHGGTASLIEPA